MKKVGGFWQLQKHTMIFFVRSIQLLILNHIAAKHPWYV